MSFWDFADRNPLLAMFWGGFAAFVFVVGVYGVATYASVAAARRRGSRTVALVVEGDDPDDTSSERLPS